VSFKVQGYEINVKVEAACRFELSSDTALARRILVKLFIDIHSLRIRFYHHHFIIRFIIRLHPVHEPRAIPIDDPIAWASVRGGRQLVPNSTRQNSLGFRLGLGLVTELGLRLK